ncbi:VOC family protein [Nocardioides aurantiacus]|uniref:Putative 3-demethylubiquinone-9 3-methyltransferase (Glyoxalase superfamily) n=1 Tax=Nocardioides aurantiacus TaxID=86796 RepID=A0A3N2CT64_9ACTN|nr:VOC family protein [Nocardioides aurantiacus]ROR90727.1 putative 3-demethylubiquinone-9 3-methyltransferase (glyoxalase superfamily) [Nocardioides aurantiacus]
MRPVNVNLWINDGRIQEAVDHWVSLFPDSRIVSSTPYGEEAGDLAGQTMAVVFELQGQPYTAINGGDTRFEPNEAVSLAVPCDTQDEIDRLWAGLTDGGKAGPCGWLSDRFGFAWQVYPAALDDHLGDPEVAPRAVAYFMTLDGVPFSIADLEAAVRGD